MGGIRIVKTGHKQSLMYVCNHTVATCCPAFVLFPTPLKVGSGVPSRTLLEGPRKCSPTDAGDVKVNDLS